MTSTLAPSASWSMTCPDGDGAVRTLTPLVVRVAALSRAGRFVSRLVDESPLVSVFGLAGAGADLPVVR